MAKFSQLARPDRARKPVTFVYGKTSVEVALTTIDFLRESEVIESAKAFAVARGSKAPAEGDPHYERGIMLYTVLASAVDAEVRTKDEPFFASAEEAMSVDPDWIAYLFHRQRDFQAELAPAPRNMEPLEFTRHVVALAEADEEGAREIPFDSLPRVMQRKCMRTLAREFLFYVPLRLLSGSESPAASTTSASSAQPTPELKTPPSSRPSPKVGEPDAAALAELAEDERKALERVIADAKSQGNEERS